MKIEIEQGYLDNGEPSGLFDVRVGDAVADRLAFDEMLGLVASLLMPEKRPCRGYLQTAEQREAWMAQLNSMRSGQ